MKTFAFLLLILLFSGITVLSGFSQEKKEQLWYCWEETVIPGQLDNYINLSREMIQLCKEEKFPFSFYTWMSNTRFVYMLWYPVSSPDDISGIDKEWEKIITRLGVEKYAAFNATKVKNRSYTMTIRPDLAFSPRDPGYSLGEARYALWREYYLYPGKEKEFEEAVKWLNQQRTAVNGSIYINHGICGLGYDLPCFVMSYGATTQEEYLKRNSLLRENLGSRMEEFNKKTAPLIREVKDHNWWLQSDLSFTKVK